MGVVMNNLHRQTRERVAEARANGTYKEPSPWLTAETTMGRFFQGLGHGAIMLGLCAVGTATVVGIVAGSFVGGMHGIEYVKGMVHPNDYHGYSIMAPIGAKHAKEIGSFVDGLRVTVESNIENFSAKVFVNDVAAKVPGQEQVGAMKTSVDAQLQQLHQKAAEMKKAQEPSLELIRSQESYL